VSTVSHLRSDGSATTATDRAGPAEGGSARCSVPSAEPDASRCLRPGRSLRVRWSALVTTWADGPAVRRLAERVAGSDRTGRFEVHLEYRLRAAGGGNHANGRDSATDPRHDAGGSGNADATGLVLEAVLIGPAGEEALELPEPLTIGWIEDAARRHLDASDGAGSPVLQVSFEDDDVREGSLVQRDQRPIPTIDDERSNGSPPGEEHWRRPRFARARAIADLPSGIWDPPMVVLD